jgi:hypothetical protein
MGCGRHTRSAALDRGPAVSCVGRHGRTEARSPAAAASLARGSARGCRQAAPHTPRASFQVEWRARPGPLGESQSCTCLYRKSRVWCSATVSDPCRIEPLVGRDWCSCSTRMGPSPGADVGADCEPSPGADVAGVSPIKVHTWAGRGHLVPMQRFGPHSRTRRGPIRQSTTKRALCGMCTSNRDRIEARGSAEYSRALWCYNGTLGAHSASHGRLGAF